MLDPIYYINGKWEKKSEANISAIDAGFLLGDGLFETIRFQNRKLFLIEKHLERLNLGLKTIKIKADYSDSDFLGILKELIQKNDIENGLIRLMITRGELEGEPWKYNGPTCLYISIRLISHLSDSPVKVVYFNESDYPIIRFTPAIKSMNYIGNMLAKKDAEKYNAYEPVFINGSGFITECAIRNIFYIKGNSLITPSENLGILPGVTRDTLMKIGSKLGLKIIKTKILKEDVNSMDEAFISSSGIGLLPCYWDGWNSNFKLTKQLQTYLSNYINEYCN